jgi:hypothetical protein
MSLENEALLMPKTSIMPKMNRFLVFKWLRLEISAFSNMERSQVASTHDLFRQSFKTLGCDGHALHGRNQLRYGKKINRCAPGIEFTDHS